MAAKIIDGEAVAVEIRQQVQQEVAGLGRPVRLVAVQVGENPASRIYTNMQAKSCQSVGMGYDLLELPGQTTQEQLLARIGELNGDPSVSGLILQMPLPAGIDARAAQMAISPAKDVEGMHPVNMGRLFYGQWTVGPCTPMAVVELLRRECPDLAGRETVVVGHSEIVGKPIAMMLLASLNASQTVTVCHVATRDLAAHARRAEVLVVATGVSQARWLSYNRKRQAGQKPPPPDLSALVKGEMLKDGAVVIDVAINRIPARLDGGGEPIKNEKGKPAMITVGDVDFEAAKGKVAAITPVPGGVGPVTVAMLLRNTLACARRPASNK